MVTGDNLKWLVVSLVSSLTLASQKKKQPKNNERIYVHVGIDI